MREVGIIWGKIRVSFNSISYSASCTQSIRLLRTMEDLAPEGMIMILNNDASLTILLFKVPLTQSK